MNDAFATQHSFFSIHQARKPGAATHLNETTLNESDICDKFILC